MSSPVPKDEACTASRRSDGTSVRPDACAISMTARPSGKMAHCAATESPNGPRTVAVCAVPPAPCSKAATVPSPPSASGTAVKREGVLPSASRAPRSIAMQAAADDSEPFSESGARIKWSTGWHVGYSGAIRSLPARSLTHFFFTSETGVAAFLRLEARRAPEIRKSATR